MFWKKILNGKISCTAVQILGPWIDISQAFDALVTHVRFILKQLLKFSDKLHMFFFMIKIDKTVLLVYVADFNEA